MPTANQLAAAARFAVAIMCVQLATGARSAHAEVIRRVPANEPGQFAVVSGNGRFVVGTETAGGPCGPPETPQPAWDVVIYDLHTSRAECVNVNDDGVRGPGVSFQPSVSADGQLVVFISDAPNLDPRCGRSGLTHVYLRNRRTRHTECLSLTDAGIRGNASSTTPKISATGNLVVFGSGASNLVPGDRNSSQDIFGVRLVDGARVGPIEPISVVTGRASGGFSENPALSADGRFVAFASDRRDLVTGDTNGRRDVFRRNRSTGQLVRVSVSGAGAQANADSTFPAISADGRFVAFTSPAQNLVPGVTSPVGQIYRTDLLTGEVMLVSRGAGGAGNTSSWTGAAISADGRFVLFTSNASNLVPGDSREPDLFAARIDGEAVAITRVNLAVDGMTAANRPPIEVGMSADASVVAFTTAASNLTEDFPIGGLFLARIPGGPPSVIAGAGFDGGSHVRGLDSTGTADPAMNFYAYDRNFSGGVTVASGDVDGDGAPDLITGAGPGGGPHVRVFSAARHGERVRGVQHELAGFHAYDPGFRGGVSVAVGDVTGDGVAEIITGAGPGGGPHVRVFSVDTDWATGRATISEYAGFFAYDPHFAGGVRVAAGDLDGDGVDEILTAAGPGGGPHVVAFTLSAARTPIPVVSFLAYHPAFLQGVHLAAGDLDGDGRDEIVTGAEAGGPHVRAIAVGEGFGSLREISGFYAYDVNFHGGVRVAAADLDGDGRADIITAPGPGASPWVRVFHHDPDTIAREIAAFHVYSPGFGGGVFVAGR